jgi:hypothetical protein
MATMIVTDAFGRDVRELGTCAGCGSKIQYIYTFQNKTYGSECILVVTGQKKDYWVIKDGVIDEAATAEREETKRINRESYEQREAKRIANYNAKCQVISQSQGFLIHLLNQFNQSGFCLDMANELGRTYIFDLSPRQQTAIEKVYGKSQGTRFESKKYYAEIIKMYERLGFFPIDAKETLFN